MMGKKPKKGALEAQPQPRIAEADDVPELMVDRELRQPAPLDHRIASVLIRTHTNNPTEGYELLLSGQFGKERIKLTSPEFEIEVDFSLVTADIDLKFLRCTYQLLNATEGGRVQ